MDTVSSSFIGGFILLFGLAQLIIYRKYSTQIDTRRIRPSHLYKFQIFLMLLLPILAAVRLDLRWKFYDNAPVYGFMVRTLSANTTIDVHSQPYHFSDSIHGFYNSLVSFRDLFDCQRTSLSATVSANTGTWNRSADFLHAHFYCAKFRIGEHQLERLVVRDGIEVGPD